MGPSIPPSTTVPTIYPVPSTSSSSSPSTRAPVVVTKITAPHAPVVGDTNIAASQIEEVCEDLVPEDERWTLVAHMQGITKFMFEGNSNLVSTNQYNCPDPNDRNGLAETPDFQCNFLDTLSDENEILFITGDKKIWAKASYEHFLAATKETLEPNLDFQRCLENAVESIQGNVLDRANIKDDLWVSIADGGHRDGISEQLMIWGGNEAAIYYDLKNGHEGVNVYIRPKLTALEEKWRVGPLSITDQTLSLKYGSIGDEDSTKRVIEFYARPTSRGGPTTDNDDIELNCFGESGAIQDSPPAGFGIETTTNDGETLLAITFKRTTGDSIETFDGYDDTDSNAPTVEFCVKVTLGGRIFRQLAVKYTFTLDHGAITIDNAVVLDVG
jgi:hypothetical protein